MQRHTLFHMWGGPQKGPAAPPKIPDPNALCRGLWENSIRGMDLTMLYEGGGDNKSFYPIPRARFRYTDKDGNKTQVLGTLRSVACHGYCVDLDGLPRKQWRCEECNNLITNQDIRNRLELYYNCIIYVQHSLVYNTVSMTASKAN